MKWLILFFGIVSNALASVLIKVSVTTRPFPSLTNIKESVENWPFWLGIFFYLLTFLLYTWSLSKFPLNIAHPVLTTGSVALVALISFFYFKESFNFLNMIGIILVIIGVFLITLKMD